MSPIINIAFSGKMCSGKSTCAAFAQTQIKDSVILSFASPIYEIAKKFWGMQTKDRSLLVFIGESWRKRDKNIWVKILLRTVQQLNNQGKSVIVDDLRMLQEFEALEKAGFFTVRLNVSPLEQEQRIKSLYPDTFQDHLDKRESKTETSLDDHETIPWDVYFAHDIKKEMMKNIIISTINEISRQNSLK